MNTRSGTAGSLGVGLVLSAAIALLAPPAKAVIISSHSGFASVNCPLPGGGSPTTSGSDVATVTCNDGNSDDSTVAATIDIGADPFDNFFLGVQAFPVGNIRYDLRIENSSGEDWTDFHFDFPVGGQSGPGLVSFLSAGDGTSLTFDAGGGSLDSFSTTVSPGAPFFPDATDGLDLNFATPVISGTGFDINYTLDQGPATFAKCGTCTTIFLPSNTFVPPPPSPLPMGIPEPGTLTLFLFGLAGLGFMSRQHSRTEE